MGKLLIEFGIPALIMMAIAWKITKIWFFRVAPSNIIELKKIRQTSDKYDKTLDKIL